MRRSHVCLGCGLELGTIAAPLDPHYRIPVVQCPRCRTAAVRHPARAPWRRTARSIVFFVLQLAMGVVVLTVAMSIVGGLDLSELRHLGSDPLMAMSFAAIAMATLVIGAWMGIALRHAPLGWLLLGWGGLLLLMVIMTSIHQPWARWPRMAWRTMSLKGVVAMIFFFTTCGIALASRVIARDLPRHSMAKRVRRRRKKLQRMAST